jgi:nucleoside-diphosphate-sugar epimerase
MFVKQVDYPLNPLGGSGLIGKKLVNNLRQQGHEVVAASPSSGVNTLTGKGLEEALADAQVTVDVANAPSWEDQAVLDFFETSGRNLLSAEAAAGVRHHVALSVVGTERLLSSGYFRAKLAQETLIKASRRHRSERSQPHSRRSPTPWPDAFRGMAQTTTASATLPVLLDMPP